MTSQYTKLNFVERIRVDVWTDFLALHPVAGLPDGILKHSDVADALAGAVADGTMSDDTHARLQATVDLSSRRGSALLHQVLNDAGVPSKARPQGQGPQELVLLLSLSEDATIMKALVDASVLARELGTQSRYRDFVGLECRSANVSEPNVVALEAAIAEHCSDKDLGEHVEVRQVRAAAGVLVLEINHSKRFRSDVRADGANRLPLRYRPVVGDIVQYNPSLGLLRVSASPASLIPVYREHIGRCLFADPGFFPEVGPYSLEVLKGGQEALDAHSLRGVHRVRVRRLEWTKKDATFTVEANDCFETIGDVEAELQDAEIHKAKLSLSLAKHTNPVLVNVAPPHQAPVREGARRLVEAYFQQVGIRSSGQTEASSLWKLVDRAGSLAEWRSVFATATEQLIADGLLRPAWRRRVPHPEHPARGPILRVLELDEGFWGESTEDDVGGCMLNATAVEGLKLQESAFASLLARRLGVVDSDPVERLQGLWDLGRIAMGNDSIRLWFATTRPGAPVHALLAEEPNAVVLTPTSEPDHAARVVSCSPLPTWEDVRYEVVKALNLVGRVPAIYFAKSDTELVVDRELGAIWYRGCRVDGISFETQTFRYVEMLAASRGKELSSTEISTELTQAFHGDPTDPARTAKRLATKAMKKATEKLGDWKPPFKATKGLVRCLVASEVYPPIEQ